MARSAAPHEPAPERSVGTSPRVYMPFIFGVLYIDIAFLWCNVSAILYWISLFRVGARFDETTSMPKSH
jgi:hypothetical protein